MPQLPLLGVWEKLLIYSKRVVSFSITTKGRKYPRQLFAMGRTQSAWVGASEESS